MGTHIKIHGGYSFPAQCVVCLQPADKTYTIEKTVGYGQKSSLLRIPVPMCAQHAGQAASRSPVELLVSKLALVMGVAVGLLSASGMLYYWASTQQGNLILNLILALFLGAGFGLIVWAILEFYISPRFANPEVKQLREAVKIVQYFPANDVLELEFSNPQTALAFSNANNENCSPEESSFPSS